MLKRERSLIFIFSVLAILILSSITASAAQKTDNVKRLSGDNRYATAAAVALSGWPKSDYAILCYGEDFPDALSAAPLSEKYNAPILLTEADFIPEETLDAVHKLGVKNIILVGGTGVISPTAEQYLSSLGMTVTRIWGQDRYETSVKVAEQLDNVTEIAIATGESFQDALSISPIAAKKNMPIILIKHDTIPDAAAGYIGSHKFARIHVIGPGTSIDNSILEGLPNVDTIMGNNKYEINRNIVEKFKSDLNFSTVYLATGENFADALSGSVLAGKNSNPLVLTGDNPISEKEYFLNNFSSAENIYILGGTGAVSEEVFNELISALSVDSTVDKIEFISNKLTKTRINTGTFRYQIFNKNGEDITKRVSASEIDTTVIGGPSISLEPSSGMGTIVFDSSNNYIDNVVTLEDKKTGVCGRIVFPPLNPGANDISTGSRISKIMIISTVLGVAASLDGTPGNGYVTFKAYDQYGNDVTSSALVDDIMVTCSAGTASADRDGLITVVPGSGVYLTTLRSISIVVIDKATGVSASATFMGGQ